MVCFTKLGIFQMRYRHATFYLLQATCILATLAPIYTIPALDDSSIPTSIHNLMINHISCKFDLILQALNIFVALFYILYLMGMLYEYLNMDKGFVPNHVTQKEYFARKSEEQ